MTHSDLVRIEVQGADILVAMRGTCFRVKYRKQAAPWLIAYEYGPDDPDATITLSEFRALAWAVANDKARELGSARLDRFFFATARSPDWVAQRELSRHLGGSSRQAAAGVVAELCWRTAPDRSVS